MEQRKIAGNYKTVKWMIEVFQCLTKIEFGNTVDAVTMKLDSSSDVGSCTYPVYMRGLGDANCDEEYWLDKFGDCETLYEKKNGASGEVELSEVGIQLQKKTGELFLVTFSMNEVISNGVLLIKANGERIWKDGQMPKACEVTSINDIIDAICSLAECQKSDFMGISE